MSVVFLDKDGTLIEDMPYNVDPNQIRLLPGVGAAVQALCAAGWQLVVVTNQSGVARGLFPETALSGVEARLRELLAEHNAPLAGFFFCPHHPEGCVSEYAVACECRKPAPGLILDAARRLGADPRNCWVVGDRLSDVEAGHRAGCRTVLLAAEDGCAAHRPIEPDALAFDLKDAVDIILGAKRELGDHPQSGRPV